MFCFGVKISVEDVVGVCYVFDDVVGDICVNFICRDVDSIISLEFEIVYC